MPGFEEKLRILEILAPLYELCGSLGIFEDSKTIVDMPLQESPDHIAQRFKEEFGTISSRYGCYNNSDSGNTPENSEIKSLESTSASKVRDKERLQQFISRWFLPAGTDTESVKLAIDSRKDSTLTPEDCLEVTEGKLTFEGLMRSMSKLCRKACHHVTGGNSSLIHAPYPFVIPGERFRESYYWDSYWIIKGLLKQDGNYNFCLGIVRNFAYMVHHVGKVPNGFRSYYLNRSQPPMLTCMVHELYNHSTSQKDLIREFLPVIKQELLFWRESNRTLCIKGDIIVSRYYSDWTKPRPESLSEDLSTFESFKMTMDWKGLSDKEKASLQDGFFRNISAAAESGWDFSSRWFDDSNTLDSVRTTRILPVDLNAILVKSERLVSSFAKDIGDVQTSNQFATFYRERKQSFTSVFWDSSRCTWRDVLMNEECSAMSGFSRQDDYASNWVPLWCFDDEEDKGMLMQAIDSLENSKINAIGGISASSVRTGQQWDWPNVWPPLQYFLAEGCWSVATILRSYAEHHHNDPDVQNAALQAQTLGDSIKHRYVVSVERVWEEKHTLPEKFDCEHLGGFGYGGEYECVEGFGWTTGLALHWLD